MKDALDLFFKEQCEHKDGHDVAPWENVNTLNPDHPDYNEGNATMLFDAFWPGFKARVDAGDCPENVSPARHRENRRIAAAAAAAAAAGPDIPPTLLPFTFGAPPRSDATETIEINEEESEEEADE